MDYSTEELIEAKRQIDSTLHLSLIHILNNRSVEVAVRLGVGK